MDHLENETSFVPPKNAVIIGGSLSGLMHGIVLHRLGCAVRILEQAPTETPVSHMAGVCLGPDVLRLLQRFDSFHHVALGIPSELLQSLDRNGQARPFLRAGRIMSSWDALYYRLRANFDGFSSSYIPDPKLPEPRMGELADRAKLRAVYETARHVTVLEQLGTGQIQVTYTNSNNGCEQTTVADIVIGADGPNSVTRRLMLGDAGPRRSYAGYVAWRGVVPEDQVTPATREIFRENITYSILDGRGGHVIIYNIPGDNGSVEDGKRLLNFCWYVNIPSTSLGTIMTGVDGIRHRTKLDPTNVDPNVWEDMRSYARTVFAPPYLEVLENIASPFVNLITDYCSPRSCFLGGRVLLVGDASSLLRPHIAFSTNQAAYQTLLTERMVRGEISPTMWEYQVTKATHLHWRRSVWFGEFFQKPFHVSIRSAVCYWITAALAKFRTWMGWLPRQSI